MLYIIAWKQQQKRNKNQKETLYLCMVPEHM